MTPSPSTSPSKIPPKVLNRLLETYRTTSQGRKVQWDEPGEDDTPEVRRHNAHLERQRQSKTTAKERLKKKGIVPTKSGKPVFENQQIQEETIQQVLMSFRRLYQSNRSMRFRDWIKEVVDLFDDLN